MARKSVITLAAALAIATLSLPAQTAAPAVPPKSAEAKTMHHAHGTFSVKVAPVQPPTVAGTARYSLDKTFDGSIVGTGKGEMYAAGDYTTGNAGYVVIEVITGKLDGKEGSFALQHMGMMEGGTPSMTVRVVPGSGTGELKGIGGTFTITQAAGQHSYDLEYTLP